MITRSDRRRLRAEKGKAAPPWNPEDRVSFDSLRGLMVYIAGPYTAKNGLQIVHNVRRAIQYADILVGFGVIPYVPHLNHLWDLVSEREWPPAFWYEYDLHFLGRCDVMVVMPGSKQSRGVAEERRVALEEGIPVYDWEELT